MNPIEVKIVSGTNVFNVAIVAGQTVEDAINETDLDLDTNERIMQSQTEVDFDTMLHYNTTLTVEEIDYRAGCIANLGKLQMWISGRHHGLSNLHEELQLLVKAYTEGN